MRSTMLRVGQALGVVASVTVVVLILDALGASELQVIGVFAGTLAATMILVRMIAD